MIGWERHVQLGHDLDEGYTQREIAKELGIDRQTIYRWIKNGDLERELTPATVKYGPRPLVAEIRMLRQLGALEAWKNRPDGSSGCPTASTRSSDRVMQARSPSERHPITTGAIP